MFGFKKLLAFAMAFALCASPSFAANTTVWSSANGDIVLPISPPTNAGATPGNLDNTVIGATTPVAGSFTGLTTTDAITCATATPTTATDSYFFVATRAYLVVTASEVHGVAAGGVSTLQVVKDTGTTAPGAGTDLLSAAFDMNGTANTVQTGALIAAGSRTLAAGDRLSYDFANAIQSSAVIAITVCLAPR